MSPPSSFPSGKRFAFTIVDDTDDSCVENVKPLYDLLCELNLFTTKTVWPEACPEGSDLFFAGDTLAAPEYRRFCVDLQKRGFEITWHGATLESSVRSRTERGLATFRRVFGHYPLVHANHGRNRENIYWGPERYRTPLRFLTRLCHATGRQFEGEVESSPYFWGDLCKQHMRYVRNFSFRTVNTLRCDPQTPYRLRATPYVNYWFSSTDVPDVDVFRELITPTALDSLCQEGGVCIVATHLGKGFVRNGVVDSEVEATLRHLASQPVWVAPVSQVLDHLLGYGRGRYLSGLALVLLESRHAWDRAISR